MTGVDLLVVGGTGLLGSTLVELADARGLSWAATFNSTPRSGARWHHVDLTTITPLLDSLQPAAVVNTAYVQRDPGLDAITRTAPATIAEWTAAHGARFVQLSTDLVFDGELGRPYRETDPVNPVNDYGRAKAAMEAAVAVADRSAVLVRTSLLWGGPGDGGPQMRLLDDPDVNFFTDEFRNPIDVSTLAEACLELVDRPDIAGLLHVAGPRRVDRLTFARALAAYAGLDPDALRGGTGAAMPGRPADVALDSSLAVSLLTTKLRGLPDA